jgi:hypothetical protein
MNAKLILVGLASVVVLVPLGTASGQDWSAGSPYSSNGWGYGWPATSYAGEAIPYFSLFPPVYYSYPVPRTYGYSPFAYPPGFVTPSPQLARAAITQNSYAMSGGAEPVAQQRRPPLRIDNPFVGPPSPPGVSMNQKPLSRQPKVIYPAAMARRGSESARGS